MGDVVKIAVLPIKAKKLLMCRKMGVKEIISLGGKPEEGETDEKCAEREVMEEAQCRVKNLAYFATVYGPRPETDGQTELRCYLVDLEGTPTIRKGDKIIGFVYIDKNWKTSGHSFPSTMHSVLPMLVERGLL